MSAACNWSTVILLLLVVELLNTAIEKLADRLTLEHDPQIGRVKDMGSAAVAVAARDRGPGLAFRAGRAPDGLICNSAACLPASGRFPLRSKSL